METTLEQQLSDIISRLQKIQRNIAGSEQPPSQFELAELQELGQTYESLNATLQRRYANDTEEDQNNG